MADNETPVDNKVDLQLQDIIQIDAPNNEILNDKQFVITYISIFSFKKILATKGCMSGSVLIMATPLTGLVNNNPI